MSQRRIKITIDPLGNPKVEALNFEGASCADATRGIEQALGGVDGANRNLKPEYYNEGNEGEEIHQSW